jgi:hypothetical protein
MHSGLFPTNHSIGVIAQNEDDQIHVELVRFVIASKPDLIHTIVERAPGAKPGVFVRVRTPTGYQEKALLTRNDAIGTSQEGSYVLVVGPDNVVERRVVKIGQEVGQLRIIESGLGPSDWVVTEGVQRAIPGAKIAPQRSELTSAAADSSDPE